MSRIKFRKGTAESRKNKLFPRGEWMKLKEGDFVWNKTMTRKRRCVEDTENGIVFLDRYPSTDKKLDIADRPVVYLSASRDEFRPVR